MPEILQVTPLILIPDFLVKEVQAKLAYVDEEIATALVAPAGDLITLTLKSVLDAPHREIVEGKVQRVVESMVKGVRKLRQQVLEDYLDKPVPFNADPMDELLRSKQVVQESTGLYTLGPLLCRLIDYFEKHFLGLADSFGAQPYRFPTLIPASFLGRVNYFRSFPHSLTFATHLRGDLDVIEQFAENACCDEHGLSTPMESFAKIETLLSPAVCYHLYFALADAPLPGGALTATAVGNCFRYESSNLVSLERLWNFTMREVIFVGSQNFVLEQRDIGRQRMQAVLEETGLAYRVESANDPFFIGEFRQQALFQSAFQLKYEIRARLPYKDSTLAVGSYNYHQDFFGRHLNITLPDGGPAHTGCIAFGLERMAMAFVSQYGLDMKRWPEAVRKSIQGA